MPRNVNGTYTLPLPPVVPNTTIEADWANTTDDDIAQALTDSLDRYGRGGMAGPFRLVDGTVSAPGLAFTAETGTGLYRPSAGVLGVAVQSAAVGQWTANGLTLFGGASPANGLQIAAGGSTPQGAVRAYSVDASNGGLDFYALTASVLTQYARIASDGKVYVGGFATDANGSATFIVTGKSDLGDVAIFRNPNPGDTNSQATIVLEASGNYVAFGAHGPTRTANPSAFIYTDVGSNYPIAFSTNGSERMRVAANGHILMGTPSNDDGITKLQVLDGSGNNILLTNTWNDNTNKSGFIGGLQFFSGSTPTGILGFSNTGSLNSVIVGNSSSGYAPVQAIRFYLGPASAVGGAGTEFFRMTEDGRFYGTALHNNSGSVAGTTTQFIASGTYTPVATGGTGVGTVTAGQAQWLRVGNVVTVTGTGTLAASVANGSTSFTLSLPIPSNLSSFTQLAGAGAHASAPRSAMLITGDTTADAAVLNTAPPATTSHNYSYSYSYVVV